ncbi:hypothetical protein IMCC1989_1692 [gamma proteobacterium IMCC1989]|nr:hypothetical protein IMCC1989_1692 [gamma proteobacterium IMCC1989]
MEEYFNLIVGVVGTLFGIISFIYAIYVNREARRVKDITRSGAWNLYQSSNTAGGQTQISLQLYKKVHEHDLNPSVVESLAKADQLSLTVYHDCIRFIQLMEPNFSLETIDYWLHTGKIKVHYVESFREIVVGGEENSKKANKNI